MKCKSPSSVGMWFVPCGKCVPCLIMKRKLWASRIELEATCHDQAAFITLTYEDSQLPAGSSLEPAHLKAWLKRIRERSEPLRLRYFACGEYGERSNRPHYHAILFGYRGCTCGAESQWRRKQISCRDCNLLRETWGHGYILSGPFTRGAAGYVARYVTKKMTAKDDPRLEGRSPEFARMSLKPGIGALAVGRIAETIRARCDASSLVDAPPFLKSGEQTLLLGRYVRGLIRKELGYSEDGKMPEIVQQEIALKLRALHAYALENNIKAKEVFLSLQKASDKEVFWEEIKNRKRTL